MKDIHTQSEYDEWKKNTWDKYTSEQKNAQIDTVEKASCEQVNAFYKMLVDKKKKREAIDNNV